MSRWIAGLLACAFVAPGARALPTAYATDADYALVGMPTDISGNAQVSLTYAADDAPPSCSAKHVRGPEEIGEASCKLFLLKMGWTAQVRDAKGRRAKLPAFVIKWKSQSDRMKIIADYGGATPIDAPYWVTTADHPETSAEGISSVSMQINDMGRVDECRVVASSGDRKLDVRACELLVLRAHFLPAVSDDGSPKVTTGRTRILWAKPGSKKSKEFMQLTQEDR